MIVQHNISAINSHRNLGINQSALSKNLEKLSSGYEISRAGDNAAGLVISKSMRPQINDLNQVSANAKDATGSIKMAEGALSEVHPMFQCITTLAEQVANGTYNTVARDNIQEECKTLTRETKRISGNADFNGVKSLTAGKEMTMIFQTGPALGETITVDKEDIYGKTVTAAMSLKLSAQNDAENALKTAKTAIDDVSAYRAKPDAAQNCLEHVVKSLDIMSENITEAESCIRDTDMVDKITVFTKNNILLQAVQSMLAQPNTTLQGILSLLQ